MFKLSFKKQVLLGFVISLIFVLVATITSYKSIKSLEEDSEWQSHTYKVINTTEATILDLANAESSMRGYILSKRKTYLSPYQKSLDNIEPHLNSLKRLVDDNPDQVVRVDSLESLIRQKINFMEEVLDVNVNIGNSAAVEAFQTELGKKIMDRIGELTSHIISTERVLLEERTIAINQSVTRTMVIVVGSSLIIFFLILYLYSHIRTTFNQQKQTELHILQNNAQLEQLSSENKTKNLLLSGVATINEVMRGEQEIEELSTNIITEIANYLKAPVGVLFLADENKHKLIRTGSFAFKSSNPYADIHTFGEGLVGQTALEMKSKLLTDIPDDYLKISSGLGFTKPKVIYLVPILFKGETLAVVELGLNSIPDETVVLYLDTICESIAIALNSAEARIKLRDLFDQLQQQSEELESQQEELRTTNEELVYKSEQLMASEEELRVQQEELRQTNSELENKAKQLEERNIVVNQAREAISLKAEELAISSKYKSEFLANMSHELRTPLNSILILAKILKDNKPDNLNLDQVKYAGVIHTAGQDLLNLINDILDLSKIESGKVDLNIAAISPLEIRNNMESLFTEMAKAKNIDFQVKVAENAPERMVTDLIRVEQITKNLLSNSFKFTPDHGKITLDISRADKNQKFYSPDLNNAAAVIAIKVQDSGIGIPQEKQQLIFEAFQQADGSTSRKYGGTGLGLSISKELAKILGGEIQLTSAADIGSTFTLFIPEHHEFELDEEGSAVHAPLQTPFLENQLPLGENFDPNQQSLVVLIVEDDEVFAGVLKDYAVEKGFSPMLAHRGDTALEMARTHLPDAIVLDIMLPVMDGWTILKQLKADPKTKHIPVHMMSAGDERTDKARHEGAIGFLKKPIATEELDHAFKSLIHHQFRYNFKTVLLVEDQELQSKMVKEELSSKGIEVAQAFTGQQALDLLKTQEFDCIILDLNLPDISGFELLDKIKIQPHLTHIPVVINTAMELDKDKMAHIMKYTEAMVLKSTKSNNRLIDEVSLFMNKLKKEENQPNQVNLEETFKDKTILITDDDMRNIFALSSALQGYDLNIIIANNGREALEKLAGDQPIDLVLMDIMMPEMNGYEAMEAIRKQKIFEKLPIIALTAKAMKQDREKCLAAGANDFIAKPVDIDDLLSMMRVWLS